MLPAVLATPFSGYPSMAFPAAACSCLVSALLWLPPISLLIDSLISLLDYVGCRFLYAYIIILTVTIT